MSDVPPTPHAAPSIRRSRHCCRAPGATGPRARTAWCRPPVGTPLRGLPPRQSAGAPVRGAHRPPESLRRPGWLFWTITAVFVVMCVLVASMAFPSPFVPVANDLKFTSFLMVVSGWVVSLCLHEWAHAFVAYQERRPFRPGPRLPHARSAQVRRPDLLGRDPDRVPAPGGIGLPAGRCGSTTATSGPTTGGRWCRSPGPVVNIVFGIALHRRRRLRRLRRVAGAQGRRSHISGGSSSRPPRSTCCRCRASTGTGSSSRTCRTGSARRSPDREYAIMILLVLMISTGFGEFLFDVADAGVQAMGVDPHARRAGPVHRQRPADLSRTAGALRGGYARRALRCRPGRRGTRRRA